MPVDHIDSPLIERVSARPRVICDTRSVSPVRMGSFQRVAKHNDESMPNIAKYIHDEIGSLGAWQIVWRRINDTLIWACRYHSAAEEVSLLMGNMGNRARMVTLAQCPYQHAIPFASKTLGLLCIALERKKSELLSSCTLVHVDSFLGVQFGDDDATDRM